MIEWIFIFLFGSQPPEEKRLQIVPKPIPTYSHEEVIDIPLPEDRLASLAAAAGATVPVIQGYCSERTTVLGCYDTVDNYIIITDSGMNYSDEKVICVIQHEMRHKWQDDNGLIKFDANGAIINKDWIEKDARENGCA